MVDVFGKTIYPTQNVKLLVYPYGIWEVENVDKDSVFLVDSCGGIFCIGEQVLIVKQ